VYRAHGICGSRVATSNREQRHDGNLAWSWLGRWTALVGALHSSARLRSSSVAFAPRCCHRSNWALGRSYDTHTPSRGRATLQGGSASYFELGDTRLWSPRHTAIRNALNTAKHSHVRSPCHGLAMVPQCTTGAIYQGASHGKDRE
jgi:hypothetical protein